MEIDGKTVAMLVAAVVGGGGSGVISSEINIQAEVAAMHAEIDGIRDYIDVLRDRGEDINAQFDARMDRIEGRKMDKAQ